ncbi:hypothetical protein NQ317_011775 [Molorchus minor]|uniref:Chemokine interleukin-8-like domain-containing protein n=1 Tax=Molorchus minor TaxID=1323400 RepID=A0ABQ9JJ01_9CUCU|nr:hypothetical protein NQ317_011775 [Molorchus minor]
MCLVLTTLYTIVSDNSFCTGSSGSSLVTINKNVAKLRGIVKVGIKLQGENKCTEKSVVVVTDIRKHLNWIYSSTK